MLGSKDMPAVQNKKTNRGGMTLVEVMVSLAILGVGLTAAYFAVNSAMQTRKFAHDYYVATLIANNQIEFARNMPFSQLVTLRDDSNTRVDDYGDVDPSGRFRRTTTIGLRWGGDSNLTQVSVSVAVPHARIANTSGSTSTVTTLLRKMN